MFSHQTITIWSYTLFQPLTANSITTSLSYFHTLSEALCLLFSSQVLTKGFGFHLRDLCNTTPLEEFVHIADHNVSRLTQEMICKSSGDWLNEAQSHFLSNLDFLKPIRVSCVGQVGVSQWMWPLTWFDPGLHKFTNWHTGAIISVYSCHWHYLCDERNKREKRFGTLFFNLLSFLSSSSCTSLLSRVDLPGQPAPFP